MRLCYGRCKQAEPCQCRQESTVWSTAQFEGVHGLLWEWGVVVGSPLDFDPGGQEITGRFESCKDLPNPLLPLRRGLVERF